jgi:transcriptional regulator with XRE-family HTH domain
MVAMGRAFRLCRDRKGLRQEDVAALAGMHRTDISDIEKGKRDIGLKVARRLSLALGVPLSEVVQQAEREPEAQEP